MPSADMFFLDLGSELYITLVKISFCSVQTWRHLDDTTRVRLMIEIAAQERRAQEPGKCKAIAHLNAEGCKLILKHLPQLKLSRLDNEGRRIEQVQGCLGGQYECARQELQPCWKPLRRRFIHV